MIAIPSICWGGAREEFSRFLSIAAGSASETEYQLLLAYDLDYFSDSEYRHLTELVIEIKRMLYSLIQKVSQSKRQAES